MIALAIVLFTHVESISASGAFIKIINQRLQCAYEDRYYETHRHKLGLKREDILNSQDVRYVTFLYEMCTGRYFTLGALFEAVTGIKVIV